VRASDFNLLTRAVASTTISGKAAKTAFSEGNYVKSTFHSVSAAAKGALTGFYAPQAAIVESVARGYAAGKKFVANRKKPNGKPNENAREFEAPSPL